MQVAAFSGASERPATICRKKLLLRSPSQIATLEISRALSCGLSSRAPARRQVLARAQRKDEGLAGGAGKVADSITDIVKPRFVPRPVAKLAILFYGVGFAFSLVQKFLSLAIFLAVLGGGALLFLNVFGGGDDSE